MVRIGGLASGMDIDSIVADLMKAERMPVNKLKQKKQVLEWRRDDYRTMNNLFLDFRKELTTMKLSSTFRVRTTSSTNDSRVSATANSSASQSSFSISSVRRLASAETVKNSGAIAGTGFDGSKPLVSQTFSNGLTFSNGVVESKTVKTTAEGTTVNLGLSATEIANLDPAKLSSWSVKVNGKSFEVVTGTPTAGKDQVQFDTSTGNLIFGNAISKDSSVAVEYVSKTKTETTSAITKDTQALQLTNGALDTITGLKLHIGTAAPENLTLEAVTGEPNSRRIMRGTEEVGVLDTVTGNIKVSDAMRTLAESTTDPIKLELTYDQKYTDFSVSSYKTGNVKVTENFLVKGNESLNQVINEVNSSNAGVTMFYDDFTKSMTMTRKETGDFNTAGNEIDFSGSFIENTLGFASGLVTTVGANAEFTINGLDTERTSNTFDMNGVTFTLKQTFNTSTDPALNTDPAITVNINNDTTKVFDNIKKFVDKYNELIDKIQKKTSETYYKDYQPLTDEQRESLSEKQQEQWEEKSKSGLLRRDSILTGALSQMRMDFYTPVENAEVSPLFNQLASIGITTSANYLEGGKLQINEAELKKAIEADPLSVEKLFNASGDTDSQKGITQRLYDTANEIMDKLKEKAGNAFSTNQQFSLGKDLLNVDTQIKRFESRLTQVENRYWRQFTAMEKAIQKANSQSAYLMQQFSM
ncbi:flagellar filament capping protein FliD [Mesobacillus subterraneus]|uniref:flagellar filament capping protein FliD n=1 Tax=Mesobacillus subterraneus TaxID=285983 RepID=UPI0020409AB7|nr:flagellar filament capping protein FliD [Mesobacillus subterraneus]MCM3574102.1 flagellar filament capping protein FliD [Mesobacillus subterraneus]